jgi:hypothetical protein
MAGCKTVFHSFFCIRYRKPKKTDYPFYGSPDESFRGVNAVRLLSKGEKYIDKIIADGYNTKLSIFEVLIRA